MVEERAAVAELSRAEAATALRQLADGVAEGSVSVEAADGPVAADVPADLSFGVELEEATDQVELEAELGWAAADDGSAIRELGEDDGPASEEAESAGDLVGPATDAAAAAAAAGSKATFELFRDAADEWRWRLRHRNGNIIADSGEGYDRKAGAINGLESVKSNAALAVVEEVSEE